MDEKKFSYINGLHKGRWPSFRNYEVTAAFFKEAWRVAVNQGEFEASIWVALVKYMQANVDFAHPTCQKHPLLFQGCYDILKRLKARPIALSSLSPSSLCCCPRSTFRV